MVGIDGQHYRVGWNDTEYGINHWDEAGCDKWSSALEWAIHCRDIARDCRKKASGSHNVAYYDGVIDCVEKYRETGRIYRK